MSEAIPRAVLSDHLSDRMSGKRLVAAVFATFRFDPAFFERHVLPVFFDLPIARGDGLVPLVQLTDALFGVKGKIAVYYDQGGLDSSSNERGSAKLDIRRIRVARGSGIFHPKNIFALVENVEADAEGQRAQSLLVATMSANLTQAGWWENVEVCHVEEVQAGAVTRMKDGILDFLKTLEKGSPPQTDHQSLKAIRQFVSAFTQRGTRREDGMVLPHFYPGNVPFVDFLSDVAGSDLKGMNLEVISPYFDRAESSAPLDALMRAFRPRETRVYLPRSPDGTAEVDPELFASIRQLPDVCWGRLPSEMLRRGKSEDAVPRRVHAKVYRFFQPHPKREFLFVGSVNLTRPAHQGTGNLETGLFLEVTPKRRPEFWLEREEKRPHSLAAPASDEDLTTATEGRTALSLRFNWLTKSAHAYWAERSPSPRLRVEAQGVALFILDTLSPGEWTLLPASAAKALEGLLVSTSIVDVREGDDEPVKLLIEEEEMYKKPTLFDQLTLADILKYWALLTPEQKNAFLESRFGDLLDHATTSGASSRSRATATTDSVFDRFAGIFHSFHCLERSVLKAIDDDNMHDAVSRLFGKRVDSLGCVLERALAADAGHDEIDRYVVMLCARQLCAELRRARPDFWADRRDDVRELDATLQRGQAIREALITRGDADMPAFLDFFDKWFLKRAVPQASAALEAA